MNDHECCNMAGGYVCLSLHQAERTRAEEQLQQKDVQIEDVNTELQQTRTQLEHEAVVIL